MKGKRYSTEDKIRMLREADSGRNIVEICREKNISEVTFHRWKKQFGQMDLSEAKRLKALERENTELKKMLAEALLAKRVLEYVVEKNYEPGAQEADGDGRRAGRAVLRAGVLPDPATGASEPVVPSRAAQRPPTADGGASARLVRGAPAVWLPPDRRPVAAGRLTGGQAPSATAAPDGGPASASDQTQNRAPGPFDWPADEGHASRPWVDVGLHRRCDDAWRRFAHAHGPGRAHPRVPRAPGGSGAEVRRRGRPGAHLSCLQRHRPRGPALGRERGIALDAGNLR